MSRYLLDTNVCIAFLNGRNPTLLAKFVSIERTSKVLCSIVLAELEYGVCKSSRQEHNYDKLSNFSSLYDCYDFDADCAKTFGNIRASLEKAGTPIGTCDMMIASIAIANNLILVTNNTREFARISNLIFEDWTTPND